MSAAHSPILSPRQSLVVSLASALEKYAEMEAQRGKQSWRCVFVTDRCSCSACMHHQVATESPTYVVCHTAPLTIVHTDSMSAVRKLMATKSKEVNKQVATMLAQMSVRLDMIDEQVRPSGLHVAIFTNPLFFAWHAEQHEVIRDVQVGWLTALAT